MKPAVMVNVGGTFIYVVERPEGWGRRGWFFGPGDSPDDPYSIGWWARPEPPRECDPNAWDGEWHAFVTLPHTIVEWDGRGVPLFEGDVERREWERTRGVR